EHDPIDGLLEIAHLHFTAVPADRQQRGFIHDVGEIGTYHSGGAGGDYFQIRVGRKFDSASVHLENLFSSFKVRPVDDDLPIESSGAQQGRVEHLGGIGGGHDDDTLGGVEPVHFR